MMITTTVKVSALALLMGFATAQLQAADGDVSGLYLGLTAGGGTVDIKNTGKVATPSVLPEPSRLENSLTYKSSVSNSNFGITFGYNRLGDTDSTAQFFSGVDVTLGVADADKQTSKNVPATLLSPPAVISQSTKFGTQAAFAGKLGMGFDRFAVYFKGGVLAQQLTIKNSVCFPTFHCNSTDEKTINFAPEVGLGATAAVTENFLLTLEVMNSFQVSNKQDSQAITPAGTALANSNIETNNKFTIRSFMFGAAYLFSPNI